MRIEEKRGKGRLWFKKTSTEKEEPVPGEYGERVAKYSGARFLKNIFSKPIKGTIIAISVIIVLFLMTLAGIFFYKLITTGEGETFVVRAGSALDNTPLGSYFKSGISNVFKVVWNPTTLETDYGWRAEVEENTNKPLGLKINSFTVPYKQISEGDGLLAYGALGFFKFTDKDIEELFGVKPE